MSQSLEATLARVPPWRGKAFTTSPLTGGITNRNYRVEVEGESFVLRLAGAKTELLGIDRPNEYAATLAAASIGVGPEVIYFIEPEGYLVTRFIVGRPILPDEIRQPGKSAPRGPTASQCSRPATHPQKFFALPHRRRLRSNCAGAGRHNLS